MNIWIKLAIAAGAAAVLAVVGITLVTAIVRYGGRHGTYLQLQPFPEAQISPHFGPIVRVAMACPALTTL